MSDVHFVPRIMLDYETLKYGFYMFSDDMVGHLSMFGGLSVNKTGTDEQLKATVQNSFQGVTFTDASTGGSGYYLDDVVTLGTVTDSEFFI